MPQRVASAHPFWFLVAFFLCAFPSVALAAEASEDFSTSLFRTDTLLEPVASELRVKVGDPMPDFSLPTASGGRVALSDYKGKKNLVISYVPAAWTPVCSGQWPGYNILEDIFAANETALIGITVDNAPTLHAWITQMGGLWFPVASDFWPHGGLAARLGILRPEGVAERALFLVDKEGIIRYIHVNDINSRPDLGDLMAAMRKVAGQ